MAISSGKRISLHIMSAISARDLMRFMAVNRKIHADFVYKFIRWLMYGARKIVYLILEGNLMDKSKKVNEYV